MRKDWSVVVSFVLLALGVVLITSTWKGSVTMNFAYPLSGCSLQMNVADQGASALIGVVSIIVGAVIFAFTFVGSVINLASARKR